MGCQSHPGRGRPDRVATLTVVEATKLLEFGGQKRSKGPPASQ